VTWRRDDRRQLQDRLCPGGFGSSTWFLAAYPVGAFLIMVVAAVVMGTVVVHGDATRV
jgi:hypothetical protein